MISRSLLASYFTIAGDINPLAGETASAAPFRERAEAAASAGFAGIGCFHTDIAKTLRTHSYADIRRIIADNGLERIELEFLFDWYSAGASRREADQVRAILLEAAGELGAWHIKIGGDLTREWPIDHLVEEFAGLCDEAAAVGTRISLEMAPVTSIDSLAKARRIVEGADRPNGGHMVDIWHAERSGTPLSEVAALPAGSVFGVELNDAGRVMQGSMLEDTLGYRRFVGEGDFDVAGFVRAVEKTGFDGPYGVEITSFRMRTTPLIQAARRAYETTKQCLDGVERSRSGSEGKAS